MRWAPAHRRLRDHRQRPYRPQRPQPTPMASDTVQRTLPVVVAPTGPVARPRSAVQPPVPRSSVTDQVTGRSNRRWCQNGRASTVVCAPSWHPAGPHRSPLTSTTKRGSRQMRMSRTTRGSPKRSVDWPPAGRPIDAESCRGSLPWDVWRTAVRSRPAQAAPACRMSRSSRCDAARVARRWRTRPE
jgi:hypothetical protein